MPETRNWRYDALRNTTCKGNCLVDDSITHDLDVALVNFMLLCTDNDQNFVSRGMKPLVSDPRM